MSQLGRVVLHVWRELQNQVQPVGEAHLFYFVKNATDFTFNAESIRVPSARQLVYGDGRAGDPRGRLAPMTPGFFARKICRTVSTPTKTPCTSPASAARSRSAPVCTSDRSPSNCSVASSARRATRAIWCSIPLAAAARHWRSPKSWTVSFIGFLETVAGVRRADHRSPDND